MRRRAASRRSTARRAHDLSFLARARSTRALFATTQARASCSSRRSWRRRPGDVPARVIVENPQEALLSLLPRFHRAPPCTAGVHPTAVIGRGVRLGASVSRRPVRRDRRRRVASATRPWSARTAWSAPASRSASECAALSVGDAVQRDAHRRSRDACTPARGSARTASATSARRPAFKDSSCRALYHRGRRRDRREHDDRPRQHRRHGRRRGDEDRQPRADRAQRADRPRCA